MNYKILGLLALAVTAFVALPTVAQASTITSPTGTVVTSKKEASSETAHVSLTNPIANILCASTIAGPIESHGSGLTVVGSVSTLTFTGCTNSWHVTATALGVLTSHTISGYNATVTLSGAKVDTTRFGVTCVYEANNVTMGTATGGNPSTLHIKTSIPLVEKESSGLCGTGSSTMEGSYVGNGSAYWDA